MDRDSTSPEWMDIDIQELPSADDDLIARSSHSYVYKYKEHFAVKRPCGIRELEMMKIAGDCSITPRGRLFGRGREIGIVMDLGQPVDVTSLDVHARKELMNAIIALVNALHKKGVLHGDIKLANILTAPDGSLRFCDFGGSQREGCADAPEDQTLNWISPLRLRNLDMPLSRADDFFALGLTIWEVFTGKVPFSGLEEDEVEKSIMAGDCVDTSEIVEHDVREIVENYLAMGRQLEMTTARSHGIR
jgi:serine/threonine protein kinase